MGLITISRGTFSGCEKFAELLSKKLGYKLVNREDITEKTRLSGIPVEKLEQAVLKPPAATQRLGRLSEIYLANMRQLLCSHILKDKVIYNGHTGHMLLSGIPNILRIRVLGDMEFRIRAVESRLKLDRDKAKEFINNIDNERDRWTHFLYGINWKDPIHYDFTINLTEIPIERAVDSLSAYANTDEFRLTQESKKAIGNLMLASYARVLIGMDSRTRDADVKITADDGLVNVTYPPQQANLVPHVYDVLKNLDGCREVNCTIASTNILWIQEMFDEKSEIFHNVLAVARKWDAAVEMLRWECITGQANDIENNQGRQDSDKISDFDTYDPHTSKVRDMLIKEGHAGGCTTIKGSYENIYSAIHHPEQYSLIVVDNLFLSKSESARKRLTREFKGALSDLFHLSVVESNELKKQMTLSFKDKFIFIGRLSAAIILFLLVFLNQESVLTFMADESYKNWRIVSILGLVLFVPVFAYTFASTMKTILKIFRID